MPQPLIDADAIASRLQTLSHTHLCPRCEQTVIPVAHDTLQLLVEVIRLHEALRSARLESANRLAAMRAALSAARDGETDPLTYLRDELADHRSHELPATGRGWRG
jgi:hypothetical protein